MRTLFALGATVITLHGQSVNRILPTIVDRTIKAKSDRGQVDAAVRSFDLDVGYRNGKLTKAHMRILYDPATRLYLWKWSEMRDSQAAKVERPQTRHPQEFDAGAVPFITDRQIVLFTPLPGPIMVSVSSPERALDLNDAEQRSLQALRSIMTSYVQFGSIYPVPQPVGGLEILGIDFVHGPGEPIARTWTVIESVSRPDGKNWELVIRCRWRARVVLDEAFRVTAHQRLP